MANTPDYTVNYEDERFQKVENAQQEALTENEQIYGGMIDGVDKHYQDQIDAAKDWADKQTDLQNQNTDFVIEQIEQQKEQAKKDYTKEQRAAYVDYQKQTSQHGVNAEQMAGQGMAGTGFSESSKVAMYNAYQQRVATGREVLSKAILNFDNGIKEAKLQNSAALAEIAFQELQTELELGLEGFQQKYQLVLQRENQKLQIKSMYDTQWQNVLAQINQENALAEQVRQAELDNQYRYDALEQSKQQWQKEYDLNIAQLDESIRQFNAEMERLKAQDKIGNEIALQELEIKKANAELAREELEQRKTEFEKELELAYAELGEAQGGIDLGEEEGTVLSPDDPKAIGSIEGVGYAKIDHDSVRAITGGTIYSGSGVEAKIKSGEWLYVIEDGVLYVEKDPNYRAPTVKSKDSGGSQPGDTVKAMKEQAQLKAATVPDNPSAAMGLQAGMEIGKWISNWLTPSVVGDTAGKYTFIRGTTEGKGTSYLLESKIKE